MNASRHMNWSIIKGILPTILLLVFLTFGIQKLIWHALEESIATGDAGERLPTIKEVCYSVILSPMVALNSLCLNTARTLGLDDSRILVFWSWIAAACWTSLFGLMGFIAHFVRRRN